MFRVLDAYTLADLLRQPESLESIIGLSSVMPAQPQERVG